MCRGLISCSVVLVGERMKLSLLPFAATWVFLIQVSYLSGQYETYLYHECLGDNYTTNSGYQNNLNTLLRSLAVNNGMNYGFYSVSEGKYDDIVHGIALCRGDLAQTACLKCLNFSTTDLPVLCPFAKEAIVWYDNCMLRYSNRSMLHTVEPPTYSIYNINNATEAYWFRQVLVAGLHSSRYQALFGDSHKKYDVATFPAKSTTIYSLVQCTPDLTDMLCTNCLSEAFNALPPVLSQTQGARVLGPSCNFRYESYQFYEIQPPSSSSPSPPMPRPLGTNVRTPPGHRNLQGVPSTYVIVASTLGSVTLLIGVCILILLKRRKAKLRTSGHQLFLSTDAHETKSLESLQFNFETLKVATNNFHNDNKVGQGGFGSVYKGKLAEGKEIAVKRLATHSGQGNIEFTNEVILLAKLQHRNLVRLLGYCLKGNERLLIYEFVPNSSLDHFLFDSAKRVCLYWEVRYTIINGIAKGLLYLHEDSRLRVIHRDLKAGNILLDEEMRPKIADFGMARLFSLNQTQGDTTRIVGTYGYMAPEYAMHGKFSVKSDVYSFGILLLEIISGQKNSRFSIEGMPHELTSFAWENWKAGTPSNVIDPIILKNHNEEILRSIHIGLLCVQDSVSARPTMASVVFMLGNTSVALQAPSKPAVFTSPEFEISSSLRGEVCTTSVIQVSISDDLLR